MIPKILVWLEFYGPPALLALLIIIGLTLFIRKVWMSTPEYKLKKLQKDFKKIIQGNYQHLTAAQQAEAQEAFKRWQKTCKKMCLNALPSDHVLRDRHNKSGDYQLFKPKITHDPPPRSAKVFIRDVFTEPGRSADEACDLALAHRIADIMVYNRIKPKKAKHFLVHIQKYFVNHEIKRGIIQFSVYYPS